VALEREMEYFRSLKDKEKHRYNSHSNIWLNMISPNLLPWEGP
jgi:hypothetical protein